MSILISGNNPRATMSKRINTTKIRHCVCAMKENIAQENRPKKPILDLGFENRKLQYFEPRSKVYKDYSCILTKVNLKERRRDRILFLLMQVVQRRDGTFACFRYWPYSDSIKDIHQIITKMDESSAVESFKEMFKLYTNNEWDNRQDYIIEKGRHVFIDTDVNSDVNYDVIPKDFLSFKELEPSEHNSCLPYKTQVLVAQLVHAKQLERWYRQVQGELKQWEYYKLSKVQLIRGLEVLLEIEEAINSNMTQETLMDLLEKYYGLLPYPYSDKLLESVEDVEIRMQLLLYIMNNDRGQFMEKEDPNIHPLLAEYQMLNCDMELLPENGRDFKLLEGYANESASPMYSDMTWILQDVWRIDCQGERDRLLEKNSTSRHILLWFNDFHCNFSKILKFGLDPSRHLNGCGYIGAMGNSDEHDFEHEERNFEYVALVEVDLGKEFSVTDPFEGAPDDQVPEGYDSRMVWNKMTIDPDKSKTTLIEDHQVMVPFWNIDEDYDDMDNRIPYVRVKRKEQIKLRYFLKFREKRH